MITEVVWNGTLETAAIRAQQRPPDPAPVRPSYQRPMRARTMIVTLLQRQPVWWSARDVMTETGLAERTVRSCLGALAWEGKALTEFRIKNGVRCAANEGPQRYRWRHS